MIYTDEKEITSENVVRVLNQSTYIHSFNQKEIDYLYWYYRGSHPIRDRYKEIRADINNKIVENRANEIVSFKVGYLCGEPIQYVSRYGTDDVVESINTLNEMMFAEDKASKDQEIIEWQMICGTSYRLILPDEYYESTLDECPFEIYTLDPRETFIVYSNDIGHEPMMAVKCSYRKSERATVYTVYTRNATFLVKAGKLIDESPHILEEIPIVEYPANNARLGAFEIVLPLLDALDNIDSNRMDGIEQFIQAYWKFVGCKVEEKEYNEFLKKGVIMIPPNDTGTKIDVDLVVNELNQSQTQTLKDDIYSSILTICGMPNRNGGSSTSDTGSAVLLRDGWSDAEARAKDSENVFKRSEKKMLRLALKISTRLSNLNLNLKDIDIKFTRRNYDNIQSKSQVLISMLGNEKIHPQLAFQACGMFPDSESAYTMSMEYYEKNKDKIEVEDDEENTFLSNTERTEQTQIQIEKS